MQKVIIGAGDALVVIDMQKDFGHERGALYCQGVEGESAVAGVIQNTLALIGKPFCEKDGSLDIHCEEHHEYTIFGPHALKGTWGAQPLAELEAFYKSLGYRVLEKGLRRAVISHSASTSPNWANHIARLRRRQILQVFLCGLAYTHCVGDSAISYRQQGFDVYVIRDATRSVSPPYGDPELMRQKLALFGVKEISMADIA